MSCGAAMSLTFGLALVGIFSYLADLFSRKPIGWAIPLLPGS